jgi:hypothetical protein
MLDDEAIFGVVDRNREDLDSAAKELVAAANRSGGEDNITVVFFEVVEEGAQAPSETKPMPAIDGEPAAPELDEDTLTEADRVPAIDTMVVPPEQARDMIQARQAEPVEQKPHLGVQAARMVIALAVVAGLLLLVIWLLGQSQ